MRTFAKLADLQPLVGEHIADSDWIEVTQERIQLFADATNDHQWIHVDVERAKAGPFGQPIAHGFLTLSLLPKLFASAMSFENTRMGVNYGLNKVRFTAPVPVGGRVRGRMVLLACEPLEGDGVQITMKVTVELEGSDRPACVAESITRRYA
jgi:acyl dehydratase